VASRYGEVGAAPYLMPLSVDGLVVVASVCLVDLSGRLLPADVEPKAAAAKPADTEPDTTNDKAEDIKPDAAPPAAKPAGSRTPRKHDTGKAVARLRARHPNLPAAEIAKRLGVTDRTVRRHLTSATN
jgi:DNA-binding NarL/FixJ family response regulator